MRRATFLFLLTSAFLPSMVLADSKVWTFRPNFIYDPWNTPILPFTATVPPGMRVAPENIRAMVSQSDLTKWKELASQNESRRLVKRGLVSHLKTEADVAHAKTYLLPKSGSPAADVFQLATGYVDKFGLVGILQLVAKFQCKADEVCPEKISQKLESLLAKDGRIMKTETFFETDGNQWILATITYEVAVGSEIRVVPLRSRMLSIAIKK